MNGKFFLSTNVFMLLSLVLLGQVRMENDDTEDTKVKGKLLSISRYVPAKANGVSFKDSDLTTKTIYKYDKQGNMIEENIHGRFVGALNNRTVHKYNKDQKVIEDDSYIADSLNVKTAYKYNDNGKMIEKTIYTYIGIPQSYRSEYLYDNNGNETEEKSYTGSAGMATEKLLKYNDKNQLIEIDNTNIPKGNAGATGKNTPVQKTVYKYDDKGNPVEIKSISPEGVNSSIHRFAYNEKGNVILDVLQDGTGGVSVNKTEYMYDDTGNWIIRVKNNIELTIREIETP